MHSRSDASAAALSNAILSVAAFHRYGSQAALPYKVNALRYLSDSLMSGQQLSLTMEIKTQLAASMMLCVYSVCEAWIPTVGLDCCADPATFL